jgi:hypothetical protein
LLWGSIRQDAGEDKKSGTKERNLPEKFDIFADVADDDEVVSAQAAWLDPGRLAD